MILRKHEQQGKNRHKKINLSEPLPSSCVSFTRGSDVEGIYCRWIPSFSPTNADGRPPAAIGLFFPQSATVSALAAEKRPVVARVVH